MSRDRFTISVNMDVAMHADNIWPDGDGPADPTPQDVIDAIKAAGSRTQWLDSWNIDTDLDVTVTRPDGRGSYERAYLKGTDR